MTKDLALNKKREEAYSLYEELKTKLIQHGYVFLKIGYILKRIRDEKIYEYIGEGANESFSQFLASPEIAIKRPTAYLYIRVYEFYIEKLGMKEEEVVSIPSYKLFRLLPLLRGKTKEEVVTILNDIDGLGTQDTETIIDERNLDQWRRPKIYRCDVCNKWHIHYIVDNVCNCDSIFKLVQDTEEHETV
jgi:hypothetical protein